MSFGVDPSDGPDEAIYSTPLMLRWIARCTSDWIRSGISARSRAAGAFIFALRPQAADACGRGVPPSRISPLRGAGIIMDLMQQGLDLVQLPFDRLQPLRHADHLRPARQIHADEIFFHEIAELLLRARRGPADLIDDLAEFRRRHRLIGEGIESLLHLADHVLPHRDRIVALVCHWRPPA